ncbi:MAG: DNA/RNA nuclease SfsA [Clostridiales bacterium]|nr:DNA/RNA nuclease SfsA [Bacillota bacterium]MEE0517791.1 DNA/RNA nuclease SfsA [Anaerovoracaceae bacterium]PWL95342.1 MAG: DNA/RNA nuclease SfsA [Clostridiales bacterium]
MKYEKIVEGKFESRPNRFVASVDIGGKKELSHVKNTGRCRELLIPGVKLYLQDHSENMGTRKLKYSLIGVEKVNDGRALIINMDSQAPNKVVKEAIERGTIRLKDMAEPEYIKSEASYGDSRLDFYVKDKKGQEAYLEVKGVTLEEDGVARFPDAPTQRGIKHLEELIKIRKTGKKAFIIFIIQMKQTVRFEPNDRTHKAFGDALRRAAACGVGVLAYDCKVTEDSIICDQKIPVKL